MLTNIAIENVRVFSNGLSLFPLKKLTLFTGANSSGKSTLLKSIALIRQSQGVRENSDMVDGRLRFKGSQVDLGDFHSLVSENDRKRRITLGFGTTMIVNAGWLRWIREAAAHKDYPTDFQPREGDEADVHIAINVSFQFEPAHDKGKNAAEAKGRGAVLAQAKIDATIEGNSSYSICYSVPGDRGLGTDASNVYQIVIPEALCYPSYWGKFTEPVEKSDSGLTYACKLRGLLPSQIFSKIIGTDDAHAVDPTWQNMPLPPFLEAVTTAIKRCLFAIHYLGPLRAAPKRYYQTDFDVFPGLDPVGEFLPYVLRDRGHDEIVNCAPGMASSPEHEKLSVALSKWLRFLRSGDVSEYKGARSEYGFESREVFTEVKLRSISGAKIHSLADSGFAFSQIIPVIVRCLVAKEGDTVIVEQPELHLHPALQVRLAEFFVSMARTGRQILLETHSEHIVNAMRAIIAENLGHPLSKEISIYFLDAKREGIEIHQLAMQPDGSLSDWPMSFFGEAFALSSRILKAQRNHIREAPKQS